MQPRFQFCSTAGGAFRVPEGKNFLYKALN